MNKFSALALGTALSLSLPLAALAQDSGAGVTLDGGVTTQLGGEDNGVDAGVDVGVDGQAGENGVGVDVGTDAEAGVGADMRSDATVEAGASAYTYGDLDAALQGAGSADLSSVTADTDIEIVAISTLGDDGEFTADAYTEAHAEHEGDISTLQANVEENADLVAALDTDGYSAQDVVAVWSQADGTLTVFVDDGADAGAGVDAGAAATVDSELDAGGTDAGTDVDADADAGADATVEGQTTTQ